MIPKCMGGLWPIVSLKEFNCYMDIPIFKMPTIKQVKQAIQQVYYAFSSHQNDA